AQAIPSSEEDQSAQAWETQVDDSRWCCVRNRRTRYNSDVSAPARTRDQMLGSARALACPLRRPRRKALRKFAMARAPSPAREARALPRVSRRSWDRIGNSRAGGTIIGRKTRDRTRLRSPRNFNRETKRAS